MVQTSLHLALQLQVAAIAVAHVRAGRRIRTNVFQLKPGFKQIASLCTFLAHQERFTTQIWREFRADKLKVAVLLVCPQLESLEDAVLVARRAVCTVLGRTGHCQA